MKPRQVPAEDKPPPLLCCSFYMHQQSVEVDYFGHLNYEVLLGVVGLIIQHVPLHSVGFKLPQAE
eukprot:scaffold27458_cov18-Prasinocladus_malaysianus.AAC.2